MTAFGVPKYVPKEGHEIRATLGKTVIYGTATDIIYYEPHQEITVKIGTAVDDEGDTYDVEVEIETEDGWVVERHFELPDRIGAVVSLNGQVYVRVGEAKFTYAWMALSDPEADYVQDSFFTDEKFHVHYKGVASVGVVEDESDEESEDDDEDVEVVETSFSGSVIATAVRTRKGLSPF